MQETETLPKEFEVSLLCATVDASRDTSSWAQGAYRRVLIDSGAVVAPVPRDFVIEYARAPSGDNFAPSNVSGGSILYNGWQRIDCELAAACGHNRPCSSRGV